MCVLGHVGTWKIDWPLQASVSTRAVMVGLVYLKFSSAKVINQGKYTSRKGGESSQTPSFLSQAHYRLLALDSAEFSLN